MGNKGWVFSGRQADSWSIPGLCASRCRQTAEMTPPEVFIIKYSEWITELWSTAFECEKESHVTRLQHRRNGIFTLSEDFCNFRAINIGNFKISLWKRLPSQTLEEQNVEGAAAQDHISWIFRIKNWFPYHILWCSTGGLRALKKKNSDMLKTSLRESRSQAGNTECPQNNWQVT